MYVFGGFCVDKTYLDDLIALRLSSESFSVNRYLVQMRNTKCSPALV